MAQDGTLPDKADVLIVGAGPAGLSAAHFLAPSGASILIADARQTIGSPIRCGELSRQKLWEELELEPEADWIRHALPIQGGATVLHRPNFESGFAKLLENRGVNIFTKAVVTGVSPFDGQGRSVTISHQGRQQNVFAGLVIAADGVSSRVAQYCGIDTFLPLEKMGTCLAYRIVNAHLKNPGRCYIEYFPENWPFYFWVIPSGPDQANVGVVLPGDKGRRVRPVLERKIASTKLILGGRIESEIAGIYPIALPLEKPYADGLMIVGTAARLIDASNGEGIWPAVVSGKNAAQAFMQASGTTETDLSPYKESLDDLTQWLTDHYHGKKKNGKKE